MTKLFIPILLAATFAAAPVLAQSNDEVLGAAIGGTAGAIIGGELDNKGSKTEGKVIGAVIGGTLGYAIADGDKKDRQDVYVTPRSSEYFSRDGREYRRDFDAYGNPTVILIGGEVRSNSKEHPVFRNHPGKGHGVKKKKYK